MTDLPYGSNPGCVARVSTPGGTPGQCDGVEAAAVPHKYAHPWPHWARRYVCAVHAEGRDDAEPLTGEDRRVIAERHERRRERLAAAGRLDLIGER